MKQEFPSVKLLGPANIYFDGLVTSRTFFEPDGQRKTLGFVCAGEYEFSTSTIEEMELYAGEFELMHPARQNITSTSRVTRSPSPAGFSLRCAAAPSLITAALM